MRHDTTTTDQLTAGSVFKIPGTYAFQTVAHLEPHEDHDALRRVVTVTGMCHTLRRDQTLYTPAAGRPSYRHCNRYGCNRTADEGLLCLRHAEQDERYDDEVDA